MELQAGRGPVYYYPNKMVRIVLLAMEEVMGRNGLNAALNVADLTHLVNNYPPNNFDRQFTFPEMGALMRALDVLYGPRGGRGLALRAGRACFQYGLKEFGFGLGLGDLAFRLLPLPMKLKVGAEAFCDIFNKYSDHEVRITELEDRIIWENVRCPLCWGRQCETPCCYLLVGLLQESLYWVSGGKHFEVNEEACVAAGATACAIIINRLPLD